MKKILIFIIAFFAAANPATAANYNLIKAPTARNFYINLVADPCGDACLYQLLLSKNYLSFLARFGDSNDERLFNIYSKLRNGIERVNPSSPQRARSVKIALVLPEKLLKSYTSSIASPVLAYLISQRIDAQMKVFYTGYEQLDAATVQALQEYELIVTGFRGAGLRQLAQSVAVPVFSPLSGATEWPDAPANVFFGGIDYEAQIAALVGLAGDKIAVFSDESQLSARLGTALANTARIDYSRMLANKNYNVAALLANAEELEGASIFFNLSLIKATLIATQLRAQQVQPRAFLSTQINYHPMFLNLAQENEKDLFYFASIIGKTPVNIEYLNEMLGQKINYNWIAYSTSSGLDALFMLQFGATGRNFEEHFISQQLDFKTRVYSSANSKFTEVR